MEKKPEPVPEKKQRVTTSALKRNASIKKDMRPDLEQAVIKKLEHLGVKSVSSHFKAGFRKLKNYCIACDLKENTLKCSFT